MPDNVMVGIGVQSSGQLVKPGPFTSIHEREAACFRPDNHRGAYRIIDGDARNNHRTAARIAFHRRALSVLWTINSAARVRIIRPARGCASTLSVSP